MAKYKKRKDGRYATSIIIGYKNNGKPKRKVLYGKTIRELDNKVADFKSLQNKGIIINDNSMTMAQWAKKWLKLYKQNKAYNTYTMYKNAVNTHIIPAIGDMRLSALKKNHLQELLNNIVADGKQRSAEIVRLTLKQIIQAAIEEQYIYVDISNKLSLPQRQAKEKRVLTDDEVKIISNADLPSKQRAFIDLLYYTGMRRGEALALRVSDLDFVNRKVCVNKTIVFKGNTPFVEDTTKTKAGIREIPMPDMLIKSLKRYLSDSGNISHVFTQSTNTNMMTVSSFRKFWKGIIKTTELPNDVTPHILRHTYATKLYYAGVDLKTAQYLLGHSNIQITLEIYTHLDKLKTNDIGDKINKAFNHG